MTNDSTAQASTEQGERKRTPLNRPSALLIFLLVLYALLFAAGPESPFKTVSKSDKHTSAASDGLDNDSLQLLVSSDLEAKLAYISSADSVIKPSADMLRKSLSAAEDLVAKSHNSPMAARRVMILRSLLKLDTLGLVKRKYSPLAAFTTDLPAGVESADLDRLRREGKAWKTVFGGKASPKQYANAAKIITSTPNIRWWKWPAQSAIWTRAGDISEANRYATKARDAATPPLFGLSVAFLLRVGLGLLGVVLLGVGVAAGVKNYKTQVVPFFYGLWDVAPEPKERRLTSDDLLCVFVMYLVGTELLSFIVSGYEGIGPKHLLAFHGLITPFKPRIQALSPDQRAILGVGLQSAGYIISALPAFGLLLSFAHRRKASLAEIGWTGRDRGKNILYGIGGFAISGPILLIVSMLANRAFQSAPDPSNPVIPELVFASSPIITITLIALAVLCAPIVEELLFRGALYNGAKMRLGVWPAIVLSGLVFGCIHPVGIAEKLALSSLGMVFAWVAETRKSLVPSMTAHAINNAMSTILLILVLQG